MRWARIKIQSRPYRLSSLTIQSPKQRKKMKINTYVSPANDEVIYHEVTEPITANDVIFQTSHIMDDISGLKLILSMVLKEDLLNSNGLPKYFTYHDRGVKIDVRFNGCRSPEAKKKKEEAAKAELSEKYLAKEEGFKLQLLEEINEELQNWSKESLKWYRSNVLDGYKRLNIKESLLTRLANKDIDEPLKQVEEEISALKAKRDELRRQQKASRNQGMLELINIGEIKSFAMIHPDVQKEIREIYQNNKGFSNESIFF